MDYSTFSSKLIHWYHLNKRNLPWRNSSNPFHIWLSEIILQQTRVNQGMPYYLEFIEKFRNIEDLSNASEDVILRTWQGLGYYSRARNLHKCAKVVSKEYKGRFPEDYSELLKLPGIGPYTASAIASIAFNKPHAVVDGNVERVISRVMGITENIVENVVQKQIQQYAQELMPVESPGVFNQAMMELGAMICTPQNPSCNSCPVVNYCFAKEKSMQNQIPKKIKKLKRRSRYFYYWVLRYQDNIAFIKRDHQNIWRGLYEFYLVEKDKEVNFDEALDPFLQKLLGNKIDIEEVFKAKKHVLTHQDIYAQFIITPVDYTTVKRSKLNFYTLEEMKDLPKPILIDKFLSEKII